MEKPKRSIFFKIFSINAITLIASVLLLVLMQTILVSQYIYREKILDLKNNAREISSFIEQGTSPEHLRNFLYGFSHSTRSNILIVGKNGDILLASAGGGSYNENSRHIDKKHLEDVLAKKETVKKGTLGDIYQTDMFTLQIPVLERQNDSVIGAILLSAPVPDITREQFQIYKILMLSLLLAILVSFILSFVLSKRISSIIKRIGTAAKHFAQGDFSMRVSADKHSSSIIEINELAHTFNSMAESLEKSEDIRSNFLSDVAHELRTPMTTISGFVDGILDETIPEERQRDYLLIVRDEVLRLSSLVNSFLSLTRLKAGNGVLEITVFDIGETLRRTLVGFESKVEEKEIEIKIVAPNEPCLVKADMNLIRQVLNNLLENAVKFTNQKGIITISLKNEKNDVLISVHNTGCGIADSEKALIFERFYKADKSRSLNREGTGIGLYIVKDILSRHKRKISVTSKEGEFAEFTFSLEKGKY